MAYRVSSVLLSLKCVEDNPIKIFLILSLFRHKIKLWSSQFDHAHWCWPRKGSLVTSDATSGTANLGTNKTWQAFSLMMTMCYLREMKEALLLVIIARNSLVITDKKIRFLTWRHGLMEPRLFLCWNSRPSSLGVAVNWTLSLDFAVKTSRNWKKNLEIPFS